MSSPRPNPRLRGLSPVQFWGSFIVLLGIFLFWSGPIWQHAYEVDAAVFASYVPIPVIVAGCLVWARRFSWKWLALDTIALTGLKFSVTYAIATALWATSGAPDKVPQRPREYAQPAPAAVAPAPTPLVATVTRAGRVVDAAGAPAEGVLVYVSEGLESYHFAVPSAPVVLRHDGTQVSPAVAVVQTYQPLELRSVGQLHTFIGEADGQRLFNRAAPLGAPATVHLLEPAGIATVRSRLDPDASGATLGVFAHPFAAVTGADGAFLFEDVPDVPVQFATHDPRGRVVSIQHRQAPQ